MILALFTLLDDWKSMQFYLLNVACDSLKSQLLRDGSSASTMFVLRVAEVEQSHTQCLLSISIADFLKVKPGLVEISTPPTGRGSYEGSFLQVFNPGRCWRKTSAGRTP